MSGDLSPLLDIMRRLRDPETGCAWDCAQNFGSIAAYTIEEAYEVADAISRNDLKALKDELGDLLLQVVFHSQMAAELGLFTVDNVIEAITGKMVRRHPHIFGAGPSDGWEEIKASERRNKEQHGALDGVALALPALKRAEKLQKRASRVGFDWPDASGPETKIAEEMDELRQAGNQPERTEEFGDLLFAMVNYGRHLGIDAEAALRLANDKFERRFQTMESIGGATFNVLPLNEKEELWQRAKQVERE